MMEKFTGFYEAFHFLDDHPMFKNKNHIGQLDSSLDIMVVKVDPNTETIEDDKSRNTAVRVWLEAGPYDEKYGYTHDIELDTGGATFEEAIVNLANLVLDNEEYGNYEERIPTPEELAETDAFFKEISSRSN